MEKEVNYQKLYTLQDDILDIVFDLNNDFYLTGGTALHRFYYEARYSDDLDFFVNNGQTFNEDVNIVIESLINHKYGINVSVKSRDFYRIIVNDLLQLDFVNDRVYRYSKSNIINNHRIDNKINILTNKINAIIGRDEEKDIFDIFCLAFHEDFNWGEMIEIANKKAIVEKDIFLYRLKSFPLHWLEKIKSLKNITITPKDVETLMDDILHNSNNSLIGEA